MDFSNFISGSPLWVIVLACIIYAALVVTAIVIIWRNLLK